MFRAAHLIAFLSLGAILMSAAPLSDKANALHFSSIVIDTHDDTTQRLLDPKFNLADRHSDGNIDIPRMRDGGLSAIFFSIWIPSKTTGPEAVKEALDQIDAVRETIRKNPSDLLLATSADDIREARKQHKIAALMGVEGGHMIGNDLSVLRTFAALGVRYMTLTHMGNTEWADSSTDTAVHNGLTDFGKDVVREMNRLGMVVDIAHVSDKTFYDVLAVSKAPMIASHSSCRALCNAARNMSDDMIRDLAKHGGVIQINYARDFIDQAYKDASEKVSGDVVAMFDALKKECNDDDACIGKKLNEQQEKLTAEGKLPHVNWERIVEHIDHAVKLVGADHVGLGSDFDGATMPEGMEDCSKIPKITEALLRKGYSEEDICKILGGNTLRIMEQAEAVSRELNAQP